MTIYHVTGFNRQITAAYHAIIPSIMALSDGTVTGVLPLTNRTRPDEVRAWINAQTFKN